MKKSGGKMISEQVYSASYFSNQRLSLQVILASSDEAALEKAWLQGTDLVGLYNHTTDVAVL